LDGALALVVVVFAAGAGLLAAALLVDELLDEPPPPHPLATTATTSAADAHRGRRRTRGVLITKIPLSSVVERRSPAAAAISTSLLWTPGLQRSFPVRRARGLRHGVPLATNSSDARCR
jgi:hypothetical protein